MSMVGQSLEKYGLMAARQPCHGPCGGKPLPMRVRIDRAAHPYGWEVEGFEERQWLSAHCEECGYSNSFWMLGIEGYIRPASGADAKRGLLGGAGPILGSIAYIISAFLRI